MRDSFIVEELKDHPFQEVIRHNCEDETLSFKATILGTGHTAIIPLMPRILLAYYAGIPEKDYWLRYSHYYHDNIMLNICLSGKVVHEEENSFEALLKKEQSFLYDVRKNRSLVGFKKGEKFEQATLVFGKEEFQACLNRFFDEGQQEDKQECLNAIFSEGIAGKIFDLSKEIKIIIKQIINCRLTGNYRRVFLECKLFEMLAYYFQSITEKPSQEIKFSSEDVQKLQQVKRLLKESQTNNLSIEKICKEVGLNRFKLGMGFQALFNISVIKFCRQCILSKAYHDLQNDKISVEQIASRYGYGSTQAFSTAFFKEFGVRPSMIKK